MSDKTAATADNTQDDDLVPDELTLLKKRADMVGLSYHPSIGVASLKAKLEAHLAGEKPEAAAEPTAEKVSKAATEAQLRKTLNDEARRLVRLRITNLNPAKKDLHGEIFTVANDYIGIVKKFIPYGEVTEDGYHVENVIYEQMKARKFLQIKTRKDPQRPGNMLISQKWVPEFALEVLPQLTKEELDELARVQAMKGGVGDPA